MKLDELIIDIQSQIKAGYYQNEASVISGIINPILNALDWPIYQVNIVRPEFTVGSQRIDLALFCNNKPQIFIEAKQIGKIEGAEKQLFEYAFHTGVPIVILSDGQEWNFYLPSGFGSYNERKVRKLDLLEDNITELKDKFGNYLEFKNVCAGIAKKNLEKDYEDVTRIREIENNLPIALNSLIKDNDEILIELIASKVEDFTNFKPDGKTVISFLKKQIIIPSYGERKSDVAPVKEKTKKIKTKPSGSLGFTRMLSAKFGDKITGNRWANLITAGIEIAMKSGYRIDDLKRSTTINLKMNKEDQRGFKFIPKANISYQGMDANKSWENALKLARLLKQEIEVEFEWSSNPNASFPGKKETLYWKP